MNAASFGRRFRSRARLQSRLAALLVVASASSAAQALPDLIFGGDMDVLSMPRFTQAGFASITTCTFAPGQVPPAACSGFTEVVPDGVIGAGYLAGKRPSTDVRRLPSESEVDADLWSDGHVTPVGGATLRISGLQEGDAYDLLIFGEGGGGVLGIKTFFEVDGTVVGSILGAGGSGVRETLQVPVVVGSDGWIDVRFYGGTVVGGGVVHGLALAVPEPGTGLLSAVGLCVLAGLRRTRQTRLSDRAVSPSTLHRG